MQVLLDGLPAPSAPISEPWRLTVSTLIGRWGRIPPKAMPVLSMLDRIGSIRLTPEGVVFDEQDVEWEKVRQIRMLNLSQALSKAALSHEIQRLSRLLPPIPGRRKLALKVGEGLTELAVAALARAQREGNDRPTVSQLVCAAPFGRTRVVSPGAFVTATLGAIEAVNSSVVVTAQSHGAEVITRVGDRR